MTWSSRRKIFNTKYSLGIALIMLLVSLRYFFNFQFPLFPKTTDFILSQNPETTITMKILEDIELVRENETLLLRWRNKLDTAEDDKRLAEELAVYNNSIIIKESSKVKLEKGNQNQRAELVPENVDEHIELDDGQLPQMTTKLPLTKTPASFHTVAENEETQDILSDRDSNIIYNAVELYKKHTPFSGESAQPNILLLSSMGRSGSSFLGGILNSEPKAFYLFEPFHNIEKWKMMTEENCVQSLRNIYTCNMKGLILKAIQKNHSQVMQLNKVNPCRKNTTNCMSSQRLNNACKKKPFKVVKTIRTRVSWLPPLLQDPAINLFVIHLVRDPRASLISAWEVEWSNNPTKSCTQISEDMQSGRSLALLYPDRYMMVRYEDLCADPGGMARLIFSNLGYSQLPQPTHRFLQYATSSNKGGSYSIRRKTGDMQQKWRRSITEEQLMKIEKGCKSVIEDMGFSLFHTLNATRDLSLPLFSNSKNDKYFLSSKAS